VSHGCGLDHHAEGYTAQQRQDLEQVLTFNRALATAIDTCRDTSAVDLLLDPDPLRYMWVDEGAGRLPELLSAAEAALRSAPQLPGHRRGRSEGISGQSGAARPSVAVGPGGAVLHCWLEWEPDRGERVVVLLLPALGMAGTSQVLTSEPADCFRPTAGFDATGRPWVCYGRADHGEVAVWAQRLDADGWSPPERVSTTEHPSYNQEIVAHPDGSVEVVWQGRTGGRFTILSRRWQDGAWGEPRVVSGPGPNGAESGVSTNVWDPAAVASPDGGSAYAWTEYAGGSYRTVVRRMDPQGRLGEIWPLFAGTDYGLHPSLAVTADGALWCAFDVVVVQGHGGSGPTKLRSLAEIAAGVIHGGMRDSGASVPPELLPDVHAELHVVRIDDDGAIFAAEGALADGLDVTPAALPRLAADARGGLTLAYRVHRRLPLMTYYWEVAVQTLGPQGWSKPTTYADSDGGAEEVALAGLPDGALACWQTDGRLEQALAWTEGFGGRGCPHLLEHLGEVVWHGVHGTGEVRSARVLTTGAARAPLPLPGVRSGRRREVRGWVDAPDAGRRVTSVGSTELTLYWGDLHRHSLISRCTSGDEPSLEDFYRYSWDVCEYDFWAVTDHSENSSAYQWWSIQKIADLFHVDGRFVPMYGFEWTGDTGHQNVIYSSVERGAPIYSSFAAGTSTPDGLWNRLRQHPDFPALTIPHHPGSAMVPYDWDFYDPEFLRIVEVFQACRGNYESDGCYRQYSDGTLRGTFAADGLRRGYRYGFLASSDHGHGASFVGAYAERLDRASIFEALHARRVFGATTRGVAVEARIGATFMGGETTARGPVDFDVFASGFRDLARVDVVRDGETVFTVVPELDLPAGWLAFPLRLEWGRGDGTVDWSGSLRVKGGEILQTPYWSPEIVSVGPAEIAWRSQTKSFGFPYGAQRGGVDVTVLAPPDARVEVGTAHGERTMSAAELSAGPIEVPVRVPGQFLVQLGVGGLTSLGRQEHRLRYTDAPTTGSSWYYARVYQVDGEMAWSSPIWVDRPPPDQPECSPDTPPSPTRQEEKP